MTKLFKRMFVGVLMMLFVSVSANAGFVGYFSNNTMVVPAYLITTEHADLYYQDFTGDGFLENDGVVALECEKAVVKTIVINAGALFDFDEATIREGDVPVLDILASFLNAHPEVNVKVAGHTCSIGSDEYNQVLSEKRADAVEAYFVDRGVSADRIESAGFGETQPAFDNNTRDNRAKNRRVEITTWFE